MRQGVDTVKPDVHVRRFAEAAVGRKLRLAWMIRNAERLAPVDGKRWRELHARVIDEPERERTVTSFERGELKRLPASMTLEGPSHADFLIERKDAGFPGWAGSTAARRVERGRSPSPSERNGRLDADRFTPSSDRTTRATLLAIERSRIILKGRGALTGYCPAGAHARRGRALGW